MTALNNEYHADLRVPENLKNDYSYMDNKGKSHSGHVGAFVHYCNENFTPQQLGYTPHARHPQAGGFLLGALAVGLVAHAAFHNSHIGNHPCESYEYKIHHPGECGYHPAHVRVGRRLGGGESDTN